MGWVNHQFEGDQRAGVSNSGRREPEPRTCHLRNSREARTSITILTVPSLAEASEHGDLVVASLEDTYLNLTVKV